MMEEVEQTEAVIQTSIGDDAEEVPPPEVSVQL